MDAWMDVKLFNVFQLIMERWKSIFSKYDANCSGLFQLDDVKKIISALGSIK